MLQLAMGGQAARYFAWGRSCTAALPIPPRRFAGIGQAVAGRIGRGRVLGAGAPWKNSTMSNSRIGGGLPIYGLY